MKYIDRVYKVNADDESYISGIRLELTNIEFFVLKEALQLSIIEKETTNNFKVPKQFNDIFNKLSKIDDLLGKEVSNVEL